MLALRKYLETNLPPTDTEDGCLRDRHRPRVQFPFSCENEPVFCINPPFIPGCPSLSYVNSLLNWGTFIGVLEVFRNLLQFRFLMIPLSQLLQLGSREGHSLCRAFSWLGGPW